jgi:D-sedoheptulose 7-phosphate isomerase
MTDTHRFMEETIRESIAVKEALLTDIPRYADVAERLIDAYRGGHQLLVFGNGGSAADAQHIAAEFVGRFAFDRPALPALALTVNTSILTALGNDYSFEQVFARQIEASGRPGDVALGITTSGGSRNVVAGLRTARDRGLFTGALSGAEGGAVAEVADTCICIPSRHTPRIQEGHILIAHMWCDLLERALFPDHAPHHGN